MLGFLRSASAAGADALVTLDVARRVASFLGNVLAFANAFVAAGVEDPMDSTAGQQYPIPNKRPASLGMREREALLRRRVHQCFVALGFSAIPDATQQTLLQSALSLFSGPDVGGGGSAVQAQIAVSSGTFTSVWACADGWAFGVTAEEVVDMGEGAGEGEGEGGREEGAREDYLNRDSVDVAIDVLVSHPCF